MNKKQLTIIVLIAFFIGGLGSIVLGRFVLPALASVRGLSWLSKLNNNSPIIINRTQEVQLNDGLNLVDLIKRSGNIMVGIYGPANNFLSNGVIMTSDGLIFASSALIGNQTRLTVLTNDGQKFSATLKDKDMKTGLVALTITVTGLSGAQLDDAASLEPGHRVIYLGRGNVKFEHAATTGLITQSLVNQLGDQQISSDATFTSDYFGGPIINLSGHVVGIVINNTQNIISEKLQTALTAYLSKPK